MTEHYADAALAPEASNRMLPAASTSHWFYAGPVIAVVGRPNVGKSTLINRIVGARKAIVDDLPGVTRDRAYYAAQWQNQAITLMDTGGLVPELSHADDSTDDPFGEGINAQVMLALLEADVVILVVDAQAGPMALDLAVAQKIRKSGKPCLVAANKIDTPEQLTLQHAFYELGLGEPVPMSAMHGSGGVGQLLDKALAQVPEARKVLVSAAQPEDSDAEAQQARTRIAILGRPNVGKSSILNKLLKTDRALVSDVAGTTRDALDAPLTVVDKAGEAHHYILVDTAGIRRKKKVDYGVELFSVDRALKAMREAEVAVLVLDAEATLAEGVSDQDKKIADAIIEAGRSLVLAINKWDLVPDKSAMTTSKIEKHLRRTLPHLDFAPMVFVSAQSGLRLTKMLEIAQKVAENAKRRIKTPLVNQVLQDALTMHAPPPIKSRSLKIRYATQAGVQPPTFVLFCNDARLIKPAYQRYLEKQFRSRFYLEGTPIRLVFRGREEK